MTIWYVARAAGLSALILLSMSTALGALVSRRGRATRRFVIQYLHRVTAGLGLTVLCVHIGLILADSYAKVGWLGALVPFASGYRPLPVALGTTAAYLFVLVSIMGLARGRMAASQRGARVWRGVHALAYLGWFAAMWHGFLSGTDSEVGWTRLIYLACLLGVAGASAWRVLTVIRRHADRFGTPPIATTRVVPADASASSVPTYGALR